jgi:hypothetical protein
VSGHHHHSHAACIAIAWFEEEEWLKLKATADDKDKLDESYEKWLAGAKKLERMLHDQGQHAHRILIEVDTLTRWCAARKRPLDGEARADFANALNRRGMWQ